MKVCTPEGWRSIDPRDVIAIYRGGGDGRYTHCALILVSRTEIAGAISNDALAALEALIAEDTPPPSGKLATRRGGTPRSIKFRKELPREVLRRWRNAWELLGDDTISDGQPKLSSQ